MLPPQARKDCKGRRFLVFREEAVKGARQRERRCGEPVGLGRRRETTKSRCSPRRAAGAAGIVLPMTKPAPLCGRRFKKTVPTTAANSLRASEGGDCEKVTMICWQSLSRESHRDVIAKAACDGLAEIKHSAAAANIEKLLAGSLTPQRRAVLIAGLARLKPQRRDHSLTVAWRTRK